MKYTDADIKKYDEMIARFLGWFQEEDGLKETWYVIQDSAKYVAYSTYNNYPHNGLPFHRSWNDIVPVVEKVAAMVTKIEIKFYAKNDRIISYVSILDETKYYQSGEGEPLEQLYTAIVEFLKYIYHE